VGWSDLLQAPEERVLPWLGGRQLRAHGGRTWNLQGALPAEYGWYRFSVTGGRTATLLGPTTPDVPGLLGLDVTATFTGYLVGNRLIPDTARVEPDPDKLADQTFQVELIEEGLERFTRATVARLGTGQYIFIRAEFPHGQEQAVLAAYQDRKDNVDDISGVTPALDLAFRFITQQRVWAEEREQEHRRRREAALAQRAAEALHHEMMQRVSTAEGRRALAKTDFTAAARAALAVADAELLDTRNVGGGRVVVQYRFRQRRLECEVERDTLRVIDAGVCLTDHRTGVKGDNLFTLESLPTVIAEAMDRGKLVVWRHAPGDQGIHDWARDDEDEDW